MNAERQSVVRITLDKDNVMEVFAEKAPLPTAIQLCLGAIEVLCRETLKRADNPELVKSLEEDMYEMINIGASSLLEKMFPHIELRPDITVDAMLKAEDELLATKGEEYVAAYEATAQADKDQYEHATIKAGLLAKEKESKMNRAQKRAKK